MLVVLVLGLLVCRLRRSASSIKQICGSSAAGTAAPGPPQPVNAPPSPRRYASNVRVGAHPGAGTGAGAGAGVGAGAGRGRGTGAATGEGMRAGALPLAPRQPNPTHQLGSSSLALQHQATPQQQSTHPAPHPDFWNRTGVGALSERSNVDTGGNRSACDASGGRSAWVWQAADPPSRLADSPAQLPPRLPNTPFSPGAISCSDFDGFDLQQHLETLRQQRRMGGAAGMGHPPSPSPRQRRMRPSSESSPSSRYYEPSPPATPSSHASLPSRAGGGGAVPLSSSAAEGDHGWMLTMPSHHHQRSPRVSKEEFDSMMSVGPPRRAPPPLPGTPRGRSAEAEEEVAYERNPQRKRVPPRLPPMPLEGQLSPRARLEFTTCPSPRIWPM